MKSERGVMDWTDPTAARAWIEGDGMGDLLALPRRISAALVATEGPEPRLIIDAGAGPGAYLEVFLSEHPALRGVWVDISPTMLEEAQRRLADFAERVTFVTADMAALGAADLPDGVDVVTSSRASHHLDRAGLEAFYGGAAARLRAGGWLFNLDHTHPGDAWDRRYRSIRPRFIRRDPSEPSHPHTYPLPSVEDHLAAMRAAGLTEIEIGWKAFYTVLLVGRRA
jgi:SAM-dependent methyltransferase